MEIERKFLIDSFPPLPVLEEKKMQQGYLSVTPVVRIRRTETPKEVTYILCIKGEGTLVRQEIELSLTHEQFCELEKMLEAPMIEKLQRVYLLDNGLKLECNCVEPHSSSAFWYAEVEFSSEKAAADFLPPAFLGKEVTEDGSFSMRKYWIDRLKNKRATLP